MDHNKNLKSSGDVRPRLPSSTIAGIEKLPLELMHYVTRELKLRDLLNLRYAGSITICSQTQNTLFDDPTFTLTKRGLRVLKEMAQNPYYRSYLTKLRFCSANIGHIPVLTTLVLSKAEEDEYLDGEWEEEHFQALVLDELITIFSLLKWCGSVRLREEPVHVLDRNGDRILGLTKVQTRYTIDMGEQWQEFPGQKTALARLAAKNGRILLAACALSSFNISKLELHMAQADSDLSSHERLMRELTYRLHQSDREVPWNNGRRSLCQAGQAPTLVPEALMCFITGIPDSKEMTMFHENPCAGTVRPPIIGLRKLCITYLALGDCEFLANLPMSVYRIDFMLLSLHSRDCWIRRITGASVLDGRQLSVSVDCVTAGDRVLLLPFCERAETVERQNHISTEGVWEFGVDTVWLSEIYHGNKPGTYLAQIGDRLVDFDARWDSVIQRWWKRRLLSSDTMQCFKRYNFSREKYRFVSHLRPYYPAVCEVEGGNPFK